MPAPTPTPSLPPLFGKARSALGWQGYTTEIPDDWNPGKFSGNRSQGNLRVDDEAGMRFELRWEESRKTPDIEKSVANFLKTLEKEAKKRGEAFKICESAKVVGKSNKNRQQVTDFGWIGEAKSPNSCGFGAAWFCPLCNRVTFAHIVGHPNEKTSKIERLASEILTPLHCHGEGGWDSWSLFDLKIEIPTEFELARAQLLLNKSELEWVRPWPNGLYGWGKRAERLKMTRFPVSSVLLADTSLQEWAERNVRCNQKLLRLDRSTQASLNGHEAVLYRGGAKDPRVALSLRLFDILLRRRTPPGEVRVWNCENSNRIWVFENEVSAVNEHVVPDVLDSLQCH